MLLKLTSTSERNGGTQSSMCVCVYIYIYIYLLRQISVFLCVFACEESWNNFSTSHSITDPVAVFSRFSVHRYGQERENTMCPPCYLLLLPANVSQYAYINKFLVSIGVNLLFVWYVLQKIYFGYFTLFFISRCTKITLGRVLKDFLSQVCSSFGKEAERLWTTGSSLNLVGDGL